MITPNLKSKILITALLPLLICCLTACSKEQKCDNNTKSKSTQEVILKDHGPQPLVLDIENYTETNSNFRLIIWTGDYLQVALMSIEVGGEIGLEVHPDGDQFLRIEQGKAQILIGDTKENLSLNQQAEDDFAIIIPAGKWHNIINIGDTPLKIYSIYGPPEHPHGTIHKTPEDDVHN